MYIYVYIVPVHMTMYVYMLTIHVVTIHLCIEYYNNTVSTGMVRSTLSSVQVLYIHLVGYVII